MPEKVNNRTEIIKNDSVSEVVPFRIVNIGNSKPINFNTVNGPTSKRPTKFCQNHEMAGVNLEWAHAL